MNLFLGEHGETIIYGIIGAMLVVVICMVFNTRWKGIAPEYNLEKSSSNRAFVTNNKGKYPKIDADSVIYADYKDDGFVLKDHVKARDCDGKDISENIRVYDNVNVKSKGIYKAKLVVKNSNNLVCVKYINVVVE